MDNCIIGKRTTSSYFYISFKSVPSSVSSAMCTSLTSIVSAYINDMTETSTSSQTKLFVDDRLLSNNNQVDHNLLQKDLTSLEDWQMIFCKTTIHCNQNNTEEQRSNRNIIQTSRTNTRQC